MKKILFSIFLFISVLLYSQVDREFWFVAPYIAPQHAGNQQVMFCITAQEFDANVTIREPANPLFTKIDTFVPAGKSVRIIIDATTANPYFTMDAMSNLAEYQTNNFLNFDASNIQFQKVLNYGISIGSNADITVYYDIAGGWNMDMYALKGKNALGNEFYCPFQNIWPNDSRAGWYENFSQIDIVATAHSTKIYIVPTAKTSLHTNGNLTNTNPLYITFPDTSPVVNKPGDTIIITLNEGQTYSLRAWERTAAGRLAGTHIWTTDKLKPIAVTITDDSANPPGGCADVIGDQLLPVNICGNRYAIMGSKLNAPIDGWFFVAIMFDNTTITINDGTTTNTYGPYNRSIDPLQAVRSFQIPAGKSFVYLESSNPVCVLHVAGFGCETGGAILPPVTSCTGSTGVSFYRLDRSNDQFFINMMTRHGAQSSFKAISECGDTIPIPSSWFEYVPGSGDTLSSTSPTRGLWVLKDAYKQFGCTGAWPNNCVAYKGTCVADGDASAGSKNGIGIKVNRVTRIINTVDLFHLGMYSGGPGTTCQYGYFSSYNFKQRPIIPSNPYYYLCDKNDTAYLHVGTSGISYEWWYDRNGMNDTVGSKQYLEPGHDKDAACKAYGFILNPPDTMKQYYFKVKINRGICLGDTLLMVRVRVLSNIIPDFTFSKNSFCSGDSITITNSTTGASHYLWQKKDKYSSNWQYIIVNPVGAMSFKYTSIIPYDSTSNKVDTIRLFATKEVCSKILDKEVTVLPGVKAGFGVSPQNGCGPLPVTFSDTSKGYNITDYKWLFGDGDSAITANTSHNYKSPIIHPDTVYKVKLSIKNSNNCVSEKLSDIQISKAVSGFESDLDKICTPDTIINLTNKSFSDSVIWVINNNNGSKRVYPSVAGRLELQGNYSASIRMDTIIQYSYSFYDPLHPKDINYACKDSLNKVITIYPLLKAGFTMSPENGCGPLNVSFTDTSKGNDNTKNKWYFGDGDSADMVNPAHTFSNPVNQPDTIYQVKLIIKISGECTTEKALNISVGKAVSLYTLSDDKVCTPYTAIKVSDKSLSDSLKWIVKNSEGTVQVYPDINDSLLLADNITSLVRNDTLKLYAYSFYDTLHPKNLSYACIDSVEKVIMVYPASLCPDTLKKYILSVISGLGSGHYKENQVVEITADSILNKLFYNWTGGKGIIDDSTKTAAKITMPTKDVTVTAKYNNQYKLTVVSGTGSGLYIKGDKIDISADSVLGKLFIKWDVDNMIIMDSTKKAITLTMPMSDVTFQAIFKNIYNVIVNNGKGSGKYLAGSEADVEADSIEKMLFVKWTGEVLWIQDTLKAKTKMIIPDDVLYNADPNPNPEIVINAFYKKLWKLTVNNADGSGFYSKGTKVKVEWIIPPCEFEYPCISFVKWIGDTVYLQNIYQESTFLTMPDTNATVTAMFTSETGMDNNRNEFEIYPVPASSYLNINNSEKINEIRIVNMTGQVLLEQKNISQSNISELDVRTLAPGIYILQVEMIDGTRKIARVIIAR